MPGGHKDRCVPRRLRTATSGGSAASHRRPPASLLQRHAARDAPSFLYYLAPEQLAAEAGQGLVVLAERTTASRDRLLAEAIEVLSGAVTALAAPGLREERRLILGRRSCMPPS